MRTGGGQPRPGRPPSRLRRGPLNSKIIMLKSAYSRAEWGGAPARSSGRSPRLRCVPGPGPRGASGLWSAARPTTATPVPSCSSSTTSSWRRSRAGRSSEARVTALARAFKSPRSWRSGPRAARRRRPRRRRGRGPGERARGRPDGGAMGLSRLEDGPAMGSEASAGDVAAPAPPPPRLNRYTGLRHCSSARGRSTTSRFVGHSFR